MKCFFRLALLILPLGCATTKHWPETGLGTLSVRWMLLEIREMSLAKLPDKNAQIRVDIRGRVERLLARKYDRFVDDRTRDVIAAHALAQQADRQSLPLLVVSNALACLHKLERASVPDDVSAQDAAAGSVIVADDEKTSTWPYTLVGIDETTTVRQCLEKIKEYLDASDAATHFDPNHPKPHITNIVERLNLEKNPKPAWINDTAIYPVLAPRIWRARQHAYDADQWALLPGAEPLAQAAWLACCIDELEPALGGSGGEGGP